MKTASDAISLRDAPMQGFSAGRRPKPKIVQTTIDDEDNEEQNAGPASGSGSMEIDSPSTSSVKRLNRPAKQSGSKLKLSFGADEVLPFLMYS